MQSNNVSSIYKKTHTIEGNHNFPSQKPKKTTLSLLCFFSKTHDFLPKAKQKKTNHHGRPRFPAPAMGMVVDHTHADLGVAGPVFNLGDAVEYFGVSQGRWIPAKVPRWRDGNPTGWKPGGGP